MPDAVWIIVGVIVCAAVWVFIGIFSGISVVGKSYPSSAGNSWLVGMHIGVGFGISGAFALPIGLYFLWSWIPEGAPINDNFGGPGLIGAFLGCAIAGVPLLIIGIPAIVRFVKNYDKIEKHRWKGLS